MKKLIAIALLSAMYGCATPTMASQPVTDTKWFVSQGFNLSECGPAAATMGLNWATGKQTSRHQARQFNRRGINWMRWWNMKIVSEYLTSQGVSNQFVKKQLPPMGQAGIYNLGSHIVFAEMTPKGVVVGDPLGGLSLKSPQEFMKTTALTYYISVVR